MNWIKENLVFIFIGVVTAHGWGFNNWKYWVFMVGLNFSVQLREVKK